MSFKRRMPPAAPELPQQQAAPELMDIIDEMSGFQTITVTGADGRKRRVTQRLPLTKQEQETLTQAENLINTAVTNIGRLYQYDPSSVVDYQPFIQAFSSINEERMRDLSQIGNFKDIAERVEQFRVMSRDMTMREFDNKQRMAEENLSHRGLGKSTEATEYRAAMARERALLGQQSDINAQNYGEDLQSRQLDREARTFGFREEGRNARLQEAEAKYNLEQQRVADLEGLRRNAIDENSNMLAVGQGITGANNQRAQLALGANQNAISLFNAQAHNQNQRYASDVSRVQNQHAINTQRFRDTPASFGQRIGDLGLSLAGNAAGAYAGGAIAGIGGQAAGVAANNPRPTRERTFGELQRVGR